MRSRRLINNFPEGRGPPSLYPPLPYFATWKFKSPGHQESANLISSPVAPTFISLFRGRRGSLIHLYRCESFSTRFPLSSSALPVRVHRDRRDSLTAAYRLDSSLNKGTIRVKNEAGIAQECVYFEPAYFVSPLCRGSKRIDHRENRGV